MCSTRSEQQPTVSAVSPSSFSFPALRASWTAPEHQPRDQSRHGGGLRETHLVDEVERHGPLSDPHLLGLPVLAVLVSDAVHALLQPASRLVFLPVLLPLHSHTPGIRTRRGNVTPPPPPPTRTLILELGFSMMYLMEPWMFSVHDTSHVTLLS